MQRRLVLAANGNAGTDIVTSIACDVGYRWRVQHIALEVTNYQSGPMRADVYVAERFICATRQGYLDTADGSEVELVPTELFIVTWHPGPQVKPALGLQCKATILVEQNASGAGAPSATRRR